MKRYFITQYPTFGSYKNPVVSKVQSSPYYFWWLALTHNSDYSELCTNPSANRFKTNYTIQQVYKDFGDVRYEGDRYAAFAKWWREKVSDSETRGEYLFAEPLVTNKVQLVKDTVAATKLANDESSLLISIPKSLTRKQIDMAIGRIFAEEITFERGRQTRNPNRSNARYKLSTPIIISKESSSIKMSFDVYEQIKLAQSTSEKLQNTKLAKKVGLTVGTRTKDEAYDKAYEARQISGAISRKKKIAADAITNVASGNFP